MERYSLNPYSRSEAEYDTTWCGLLRKMKILPLRDGPCVDKKSLKATGEIAESNEALRKSIEEEIVTYKQAINVNPDDAEAHLIVGILHLLLNNRRSAMEEYKILKELFPSMADALLRKWNIKLPSRYKKQDRRPFFR